MLLRFSVRVVGWPSLGGVSFSLPCHDVSQFACMILFLIGLKVRCGVRLYKFLITAFLFTLYHSVAENK